MRGKPKPTNQYPNLRYLLPILAFILTVNVSAQDKANKNTQILWKFKTGDIVESSPAVADGMVYFGSFDGYLYAVDTKTGLAKWKFKCQSWVYSSPTVVDGVVYFGSLDSYLYAVDAKTGLEKWKFKTKWKVVSSPSIAGGIVYFGSFDNYLYALDAKTGQLRWKFKTENEVRSSPLIAGGMVFFGSLDGYLYAVYANNGYQIWKFKTEKGISSSPIIAAGVIYFGSKDNYLYALEALTGIQVWRFKTEGDVLSSPAIYGRMVFIGSWDNHLYSIDAKSGQQIWKFKTGGYIRSSPAIADGMVYFGSEDNYLYSLYVKTGELRSKFKTKSSIICSPTVVDGVIYVGSWDRCLYALKASPIFTISGKVTNIITNEPIELEVVLVCLAFGRIVAIAKTNPSDGSYLFTVPDSADCYSYSLLASDTTLYHFRIDFDISVDAARKDLFIDLSLIPISGKVIHAETNKPIATEVKVICLDNGEIVGIVKSSPKDGSYNITLLATGDCFKYSILATDTTLFPVSINFDITDLKGESKDLSFDLSLVPIEKGQTIRLNSIFFDSGKSFLRRESSPELKRLIKFLKDNPSIEIEIAGHTDNIGSGTKNTKLSQARAQAVAKHLIRNGIVKKKILVKGYGESKSVADNDTEEGRQLNRRVEFTILKK